MNFPEAVRTTETSDFEKWEISWFRTVMRINIYNVGTGNCIEVIDNQCWEERSELETVFIVGNYLLT